MSGDGVDYDAVSGLLRSIANDTPLLAVAAQNHLIAQHDYMGQGLEFLVNPWADTLRTIADALIASDDWHDTAGPFDTSVTPPTDGGDR